MRSIVPKIGYFVNLVLFLSKKRNLILFKIFNNVLIRIKFFLSKYKTQKKQNAQTIANTKVAKTT